ncbi:MULTISPECIES: VOC family protein [unclassified Pseudomonas]|uniref:VOC family protein n=1 Tax=unclassified Pseudomonas TaxID=196821 RepID=UPI0025ED3D43|nr:MULTISPECIES: VOC family protein [unclassified Pseudomonas]
MTASAHLPKHGAVLFAKDLPGIAAFYGQLLGMTQTVTEKRLIVLESDTYQLVIHGIPTQVANRVNITVPPERRVDQSIKLVFPVQSLADARARAVALGGQVDAASAQFTSRGFTACDGYDPEGNVVQFREAAR